MNFTEWNGSDLKGNYHISYKIDGIRAHYRTRSHRLVSKNGNALFNVTRGHKRFKVAEIYCNTWNETMSIARASVSKRRKVKPEEIYSLLPKVDPRLVVSENYPNPKAKEIKVMMKIALKKGYEGLVLKNLRTKHYVKVKPIQTIDVRITGIVTSTAKSHEGALKEFETERGNVGTGFTRIQRYQFTNKKLIGMYIEVKCMTFTKNGKFRHPRFIRLRPDK